MIPDRLLKLATPMKAEVAIEAHAYALTQLSGFIDRKHANELLIACNRDGRQLRPLLDAIESEATGEDVSLVTGVRATPRYTQKSIKASSPAGY